MPLVAHNGLPTFQRLREHGPRRDTLRALQPFVVNVPERQLHVLVGRGDVELVQDSVYALSLDSTGYYDETYGFVYEPGAAPARTPLIV